MSEVEKIARDACHACADFANDFADISAGGLGSDDGYTTVIIRNSDGKKVYSEALYKGYIQNDTDRICCRKAKDEKLINIVKDFAIRKRIRFEESLKLARKK
jgi:coenzyme F420 hydrogenase subunit beta